MSGPWGRGSSHRHPRRRHRRHADGQPAAPCVSGPTRSPITVVDQDDRARLPARAAVRAVRPRPPRGHRAAPRRAAAQGHRLPPERRSTTSTSDADTVRLADGTELAYDVLVVATGARLLPEETEGLTGPGWNEKVFTFYDLDGATALHDALEALRRRAGSSSTSSTCRSSARSRRSSSASWPTGTSTSAGIRDRVELTYVTPLDGAFTKPVAAATLGGLLDEKGIELVTEFNTGEVDGDGGRLVVLRRARGPVRPGGRDPAARRRRPTSSAPPGLGDELGLRADRPAHAAVRRRGRTCSPSATPPTLPASKAGSVTHFEGEVLVENVAPLPRRRASSTPPTTATPTASSRPASTRPCSSTSTTSTEPLPGHFPAAVGHAAAQGVAAEPPRQADVPVVLLARPAAGPRHPRHRRRHADRRQAPSTGPDRPTDGGHDMTTTTIAGVDRRASTTRASSTIPTSGPRRWRPSWPRAEGIDELTDQHWQVIRLHAQGVRREGHRPDRPRARQDLGRDA